MEPHKACLHQRRCFSLAWQLTSRRCFQLSHSAVWLWLRVLLFSLTSYGPHVAPQTHSSLSSVAWCQPYIWHVPFSSNPNHNVTIYFHSPRFIFPKMQTSLHNIMEIILSAKEIFFDNKIIQLKKHKNLIFLFKRIVPLALA